MSLKIYNQTKLTTEQKNQVDQLIGKPMGYSVFRKKRGIVSDKLLVHSVSKNLKPYFDTEVSQQFVSIELRPKGVIVTAHGFKCDYIWSIPFYHLNIFQSDHFSIHALGAFIKIDLNSIYPKNEKSIRSLTAAKANFDQGHYRFT